MQRRRGDLALAELQRRQFGVASVSDAVALGVPESTMHARIAAGRYERLWPGVVRAAAAPDSWEARALGALPHVGADAVLSHWSAARVLGIVPRRGADALHLTVRVRVFPSTVGVVVHRTRQLPSSDLHRRGPLTTTTASRTLADLAGRTSPTVLRRLLASAVREELTDATALRAHLRRRGRLRGKRALSALLDVLSPLEADCRTETEARFLRLVSRAGIPPTAMNHPVVDVDGRRRLVDAVCLPEHVAVEVDGGHWHTHVLDRQDDGHRERRIRLAGPWRAFVRVPAEDLAERPADVVHRVRAALDAARPSTPDAPDDHLE